MASHSDNPPVPQHPLAKSILVVLSLLLLLTGNIVLRRLLSSPLPAAVPVANPVPLAMVDAALVILGSIVSLLYVVAKPKGTWTAAVGLCQLALAISSLLAVQGIATLVWTPARGGFAGPVNFVILLVAVILPALVALLMLASLCCLIVIRPTPQEPVAKWVKLQAMALALLFIPAGLGVVFGAWNSPAARAHAQKEQIKGGDASVEELAEALTSPRIDIRFWAVQELRTRGPQAKAAVPALAQALHDNQMISWPAADALAAIGPDAAPAIPALVEAIEREQGQGKRSETGSETPSTFSGLAGKALTGIGPAAMPELLRLLAHDDRFVRMTAVSALGNLGPQAIDALPALNEALLDEDEMVRQWARVAIERIEGRRPVVDGGSTLPATANNVPENVPHKRTDAGLNEPAAAEGTSQMQYTPSVEWTTQTPYAGDPRDRPPGTVCVNFDDGYRWLITESVLDRNEWAEGGRTIQAAITATRRYEHALGTHHVRIIDLAAAPAVEGVTAAPQEQTTDEPGKPQ